MGGQDVYPCRSHPRQILHLDMSHSATTSSRGNSIQTHGRWSDGLGVANPLGARLSFGAFLALRVAASGADGSSGHSVARFEP
ncbi:hypothetical protein E4U43_008697 [Claviceps pusilla]|uniref:Uncharacterized protein n=1 Tax=Claviceps pusilla TaxID=123648 RepID=A0A9P7NCQ4_9HYPO|nr:hypothetical protein E4U43_008697 [Claviceps pusilla]